MKIITLLLPLVILFTIVIVIIAVIYNRSSGNENGRSYQENRGYRTLCRSRNNRIIAGVCGGIAEHFGWSATLVRLFFIFSGAGIMVYIILAIVIPDSDTSLL